MPHRLPIDTASRADTSSRLTAERKNLATEGVETDARPRPNATTAKRSVTDGQLKDPAAAGALGGTPPDQVGDRGTVKGILAARAEAGPAPESTGDGGAAACLRGPSQLFANVVALPRPSRQPGADTATASGDQPGPLHDEPADPQGSDHHEPGHTDQLEFAPGHVTAAQPTSSEEAS